MYTSELVVHSKFPNPLPAFHHFLRKPHLVQEYFAHIYNVDGIYFADVTDVIFFSFDADKIFYQIFFHSVPSPLRNSVIDRYQDEILSSGIKILEEIFAIVCVFCSRL
jgi:hypothetical protein